METFGAVDLGRRYCELDGSHVYVHDAYLVTYRILESLPRLECDLRFTVAVGVHLCVESAGDGHTYI